MKTILQPISVKIFHELLHILLEITNYPRADHRDEARSEQVLAQKTLTGDSMADNRGAFSLARQIQVQNLHRRMPKLPVIAYRGAASNGDLAHGTQAICNTSSDPTLS